MTVNRASSFSNPFKALDHFSQMTPYYFELIIMDIRMSGINGIKLYSKIKVINLDIKYFSFPHWMPEMKF